MRFSSTYIPTLKESPSEAEVVSHKLLLRAGMVRKLTSGVYIYLPLGLKALENVQRVVREEMDAAGFSELLMPMVIPGDLWKETGRWEYYGKELLRFKDRNDRDYCLGPTHEEVITDLVRGEVRSYRQLPVRLYQIQTKFRDEARPRGGLIRVREFTMKDAYSFHTSQEDLEEYYMRCHKAYERIYARAGIPEVISVKSDSGMMGGSISHEFMLLTPIGEDSIAICKDCGFRANMEAAESIIENTRDAESQPIAEVHTPNIHTIEEICEFLHTPQDKSCKAVVYQRNHDDSYVVVFIRGDLDINETKLTNFLGCDIHPAVITPECGLNAGYIGPVGLPEGMTVLFDRSLQNTNNLSCGANKEEYHYTGLDIDRDCKNVEYHDFAKIIEGGICPSCGKKHITISRGIEVGNIFQLGTKYTKSMGMTYLDKDGNTQTPIMGCYGIGVGRLAASVCEAHHDDYGPIWPMAIAPWQVHICAVRADDAEVKEKADALYEELQKRGVEVIYDDRAVSAGVMFSDADLLGIPLRVIVSPRNLKDGVIEISARDKSFSEKLNPADVADRIQEKIAELMQFDVE